MALRLRILLASALVVLPAASAAAAPTVTEFPAGPTTTSPPTQITSGPAGALWAVAPTAPGRVVRMVPGAAATEYAAANTPTGIAAGPDGNLWVVGQASDSALLRVTPAGAVTEVAAGKVSGGADITAGPDGRMWFTETAGGGGVDAIGTDGSGLVHYPTAAAPSAIVSGPDGNLWFTETAAGVIGRITPSGAITEYSVGVGKAPKDLAVGPDGHIWFTQSGNSAGIGRMDPATGIDTNFSTALMPGKPSDIAAGPDGALWFTMSGDPGAIGRITTDGVVSSHTVGLTPGRGLQGITAGPDGSMWFAESTAPGYLGRITVGPTAGATTATAYDTTATLTAMVRPNGQPTTYHFEYGPDGEAPASTPEIAAGGGTEDVAVAVQLAGLRPSTAYTARLVATSVIGTATGAGAGWTTPAGPVTEPVTSTPVATPLPVLGKSVLAHAKRGVILVKAPGQAKKVPLDELATLPVGSLVDASRGTVELGSALPGGKHQSGDFRGGAFVVRQNATGLTDLKLAGGNFRACRPAATGTIATAAAKRKRVVRSLWGKDKGGRFRTHGRWSVASVRGTRWLTQDRCDGTLTRVTEGAVDVYVHGSKRPVRVRAGEKALVPARKR
jgi:streptogramin lyase